MAPDPRLSIILPGNIVDVRFKGQPESSRALVLRSFTGGSLEVRFFTSSSRSPLQKTTHEVSRKDIEVVDNGFREKTIIYEGRGESRIYGIVESRDGENYTIVKTDGVVEHWSWSKVWSQVEPGDLSDANRDAVYSQVAAAKQRIKRQKEATSPTPLYGDAGNELGPYERERLRRIRRNKTWLAEKGILGEDDESMGEEKPIKRRKKSKQSKSGVPQRKNPVRSVNKGKGKVVVNGEVVVSGDEDTAANGSDDALANLVASGGEDTVASGGDVEMMQGNEASGGEGVPIEKGGVNDGSDNGEEEEEGNKAGVGDDGAKGDETGEDEEPRLYIIKTKKEEIEEKCADHAKVEELWNQKRLAYEMEREGLKAKHEKEKEDLKKKLDGLMEEKKELEATRASLDDKKEVIVNAEKTIMQALKNVEDMV